MGNGGGSGARAGRRAATGSEPRRILIACSWNRSAVSYQFRELAREMERRGWESHFLDDRRLVAPGTEGIAHIHRWPGSGRPSGPSAVTAATRLIRDLRPAVTVSNFVGVTPIGIGSWLGRVPVRVCWYHTVTESITADRVATSRLDGLVATARRSRKRAVYRLHTDVAAVSRAAAEDFDAVYGTSGPRVTVQHNGVVDAGGVRSATAVDGPIVAVGRLDPSKGHRLLVEAVGLSATRRRLIICGEGPERAALEQLADASGVDLELRGETPNDEVRQLMLRSAVVAVPSVAETFGLTSVEGMAAGAPIVASDVGGLREIVTDGVDGLLVRPGDPRAFAAALDVALDPATNRALAAAARSTFEQRFELRARVGHIADWLEQRSDAARRS